jgi:hypothetical protein
MSEMTFYIEEVLDGDPPPSPPPDGGESDDDDGNGEDFVDLGDITGQLEEYTKPQDDEILQQQNDDNNNNNGKNNKKKNKKKKKGKKNRGANEGGGGGINVSNNKSPVNNTDLHQGDRVELHSLLGKIELNECLGIISSDFLPSGRFSVILDDGSGPYDLKPMNLKKTNKLSTSNWLLKSKFKKKNNMNNKKNNKNLLNQKPCGRGGSSLTLVNNEKLYVFGGANRQGNHFNDCYLLSKMTSSSSSSSSEDITNEDEWKWEKISKIKGQIPKPRSGHTALGVSQVSDGVSENVIVVFGGSDLSTGIMFDDLLHMVIGHSVLCSLNDFFFLFLF